MYLTEVKAADLIKKQYIFKLKSNAAMFLGLIALQIVGFCFSIGFGFIQGMGIFYETCSTSYIFLLTIVWMVLATMYLAQKKNGDIDFTFVGSRLTGSLANIAATATMCLIGAVTVTLYEFLLRVFVTIRYAGAIIDKVNLYPPLSYFLIEFVSVLLYFLLTVSFIYFFSMIVRGNMAFVSFAIFIIVFIFMRTASSGNYYRFAQTALNDTIYIKYNIRNVVSFFTQEKLIWLFAVKAVAASAVFFILGALISSRTEVKK